MSTSFTTVLSLLAVLLFGRTIHDFALALIVGILTGTYSSIFIASPLLVSWCRFQPTEGAGSRKVGGIESKNAHFGRFTMSFRHRMWGFCYAACDYARSPIATSAPPFRLALVPPPSGYDYRRLLGIGLVAIGAWLSSVQARIVVTVKPDVSISRRPSRGRTESGKRPAAKARVVRDFDQIEDARLFLGRPFPGRVHPVRSRGRYGS